MLPELRGPSTLVVVRRAGVSLLVIGIVGQLGWLAELVLTTHVSPLHTVISGLAAPGEPYAVVFRTMEVASGVAFVLSVPPMLRLAPVQRRARLTILMVGLLGVAYVLRGAFPIECVHDGSGVCTPDPALTPGGYINFAASMLVSLLCAAGPIGLLLWWYGRWTVAPMTGIVVGTLSWIVLVLDGLLGPGIFAGLASRAQMVGASIVLGAGAVYLARTARVG
ncbi:DUF998 domain-containing protein [Prauserella rugosa]|uniref:Uncharacterized protein DUF998 n=1 Tax=Prauserella rugosa TaxID=43354 RepID=A0A660CL08_9PSEU|nr:DUF998 domain-containing protein [Prauserella rugosa]KID27962.1 Protein of unknown function (DUF998) [Prauserella sp. Am3]KMS90430.1 hypothetical protein ACZ91_15120 [Streptomyces regensis]TWH22567.1 uncharacterized protein DUF998 [Prauserella rugosa]